MSFRIGSFNLKNLGIAAMSNNNVRDLRTIAYIIRKEKFDIVALQEVLSEGIAFKISKEYMKKSILMELGGNDSWGFEWAHAGGVGDTRNEGYAFLWNKKTFDLSKTEVITSYGKRTRIFYPRMLDLNRSEMMRQPYYGRFTAKQAKIEFRLICVHTYFGNDDSNDRKKRQSELDVLLENIYPQIADRCYGEYGDGKNKSYTILLGDYNAELLVTETLPWLKSPGRGVKPAIMNTDLNGNVESRKYKGRIIKTVQYEPTTLKKKMVNNGMEDFAGNGFACSYDHFSYEEDKFNGTQIHVKRITKAVTHHCKLDDSKYQSNFEKYYKTISDHIPIVMEINLL